MRKKKKKIVKKKQIKLRSGFEAKTFEYLTDLKEEFEYESEQIEYLVPEKLRNYLPDFKLKNGVIVENKGRWVAVDREKIRLVLEQNPDKDIRMLFMRDNPIRKGSKTLYSDYCNKHNIKYHINKDGHVPLDWMK